MPEGARGCTDGAERYPDTPPERLGADMHVDVVYTDLPAGEERRIAQLYEGGVEVKVEVSDERTQLRLPAEVCEPHSGALIGQDEAVAYLAVLHRAWGSSVLRATPAHDAQDCPFIDGARPLDEDVSYRQGSSSTDNAPSGI